MNEKDFDALQLATRTLWEVKTDSFDTYPPELRRIVLEDQVPELRDECVRALTCGFDFKVGGLLSMEWNARFQAYAWSGRCLVREGGFGYPGASHGSPKGGRPDGGFQLICNGDESYRVTVSGWESPAGTSPCGQAQFEAHASLPLDATGIAAAAGVLEAVAEGARAFWGRVDPNGSASRRLVGAPPSTDSLEYISERLNPCPTPA